MPGFAQHRGDHVQVTVRLPAVERAGEIAFLVGVVALPLVSYHLSVVVCLSCLAALA